MNGLSAASTALTPAVLIIAVVFVTSGVVVVRVTSGVVVVRVTSGVAAAARIVIVPVIPVPTSFVALATVTSLGLGCGALRSG